MILLTMATIKQQDYADKRTEFVSNPRIHPNDKIKFLNTELKLLKEYVDKNLTDGDIILCNRLQMLEEFYLVETQGIGSIGGHFWVVDRNDKIIDDDFKEITTLCSKAWLDTKKYEKIYKPLDEELQKEMTKIWITPRIKKYKNVLLKYKKYFRKGENWIETLDRLTEPEEGRCHMNAMINYLKNEHSTIIYGDYGLKGNGKTHWEYEHAYKQEEVRTPPYLNKLNMNELQKLLTIYKN